MKKMAIATVKKVCVTGAGGFVASWLVKLLLSKGYIVHGTVRKPGDEKYAHLMKFEGASEKLKLFNADLLSYESIYSAIVGCSAVFHVACPVPALATTFQNPEVEMVEPAVKGTSNVLEASLQAKVERVVYVSSSTAIIVNPNLPNDKVIDESYWSDKEYCRKTKEWYPFSKMEAEEQALDFAERTGVDLVRVCPTVVLGPILQSTSLNATSLFLLNLLKGGGSGNTSSFVFNNNNNNGSMSMFSQQQHQHAPLLLDMKASTSTSSPRSYILSFYDSTVIATTAAAAATPPPRPSLETYNNNGKRPYQHIEVPLENQAKKVRSSSETLDHIMTERKRRRELTERFIALSATIPGLKKIDKSTILSEAISHVKQLKERVKELEEQRKKISVESVSFIIRKSHLINGTNNEVDDEGAINNKAATSEIALLPTVEARVFKNDVLIRIHCMKQSGIMLKILGHLKSFDLSAISNSVLPFGNSTLDITIIAQIGDKFNVTMNDLVKNLRLSILESPNDDEEPHNSH